MAARTISAGEGLTLEHCPKRGGLEAFVNEPVSRVSAMSRARQEMTDAMRRRTSDAPVLSTGVAGASVPGA